jgi:exopolysaccharide production protein ExoQ
MSSSVVPAGEALTLQNLKAGARAATSSLAGVMGLALLGACIMINDANFRVADRDEVALDWQNVLRLGLCGLCGGYAVLHLRSALTSLTRFPMAWLLLFVGWAWLTLPFAVAPVYAAAACVALTSTALFTAALVQSTSGESITKTIIAAIFFLAIGCWIAQFVRPELGQPDYLTPGHEAATWRLGGLTHPNGLGAHCTLAIGMLLVGRVSWQWRWQSIVPLAAFFTVTLVCTGSRTSCLMLACAVAFVAMRKNTTLLALAVAGLAAIVLLGEAFTADWVGLLTSATREGNLQEISTATGRTDLWAVAVDHIESSPLWGHGYGCSRYLFLDAVDFPATHPHNLFLDTAVETGITGALIEATMFAALLRRLLARPCALPDMILLLVGVMGLVEVPIFNPLPEAFTLSWMIALGWRREDFGSTASRRERA